MLLFCLQSATSVKHLASPVLSLTGLGRREGGALGPLLLGCPSLGLEETVGEEEELWV